jgi:uncharacterized protein
MPPTHEATWYQYRPLLLPPPSQDRLDAWVVQLKASDYLYVPWASLLLELTEEGKSELLAASLDPFTLPEWLNDVLSAHGDPLCDTKPPGGPFEPTLVALGLTSRCSLACKYCHSDAGGECTDTISTEVCEAALCLVAANAHRRETDFEVSFTGPGEPTCAWAELEYCTRRAHALSEEFAIPLDLSMATNGIFSREKAAFIVEHFTGVSLSFDGPADIQDRHRPLANGNGSYEIIYKTAQHFHDRWGEGKHGFRFALRATVSSASVSRMHEIHAFFSEHFPKAAIGFEMLNPIGRGKDCYRDDLQSPDEDEFSDNLSAIVSKSQDKRIVNSGTGRLGELKTHFCKALAMPTMNVDPQGSLLACQRDGAPDYFRYGQYNGATRNFDINQERVDFFRSLSVDAYSECHGCVGRYHCAGGCHDLRREGTLRCKSNLRLLQTHLTNAINTIETQQQPEVSQ